GTVYGMILAFTSLGEAGGQTQAANLSLGISKALFHTLLGLCLAIPCLAVFGVYRSLVDRICTRGMLVASELLETMASGEVGGAPTSPSPNASWAVGVPPAPPVLQRPEPSTPDPARDAPVREPLIRESPRPAPSEGDRAKGRR